MGRVWEKYYGLTDVEVAERVRAGQSNAPLKAPFKSNWQIIRDNTFTYFNGVFLLIAIILVMVESYRDLTFLPIIIANTLIGIVQEFRAKKVLEKVTVVNALEATVIRGGEEVQVPVDDIVLDDIVVFRAGDQIAVDAEVLDGQLAVNEALLTGEADEIQKAKGAELLSGSFVTSGEGVAKVRKVGEDSYAARLTLRAKAIKTEEQSEIIRSLNKLVKVAGVAIIPIGALLFAQQYFLMGAAPKESVQSMVAAVIGMIPEGLFLLASVALAISAVKLARNKVLIHEMKSVETLAHVDVFCVDKTGTITSPEMKVREVVSLTGVDERVARSKVDEKAARSRADEGVLATFVRAQAADNATMKALKRHFRGATGVAERVVGFSSQYKYSGAVIDGRNYVLGAPEMVLGDAYAKYKDMVKGYAERGLRTLVFGSHKGELDGKELKKPVKALFLVILENPVRETAPATFKYFEEQGVKIMVISGDDPLTVSEVAKQAKIAGAGKYIDARKLKTEEDYEEAVQKYVVFGRVLPEQKRKLVKALQKQGHTVAMTGDGVNDVLALKDADASIAVASGSQAATQAAQMVLLDSDFSKMPGVVKEGRRVVNNLERSGSLFIVKNIFSFIAAVLVLILGFRYPLLPAQVSMVTMWIIGVPSFFLSQMPNTDLIRGDFMSNILRKAIPGGLTNVVLIIGAYMLFRIMEVGEPQIFTACTVVFAVSGLSYLFRICRPFDWYRKMVWSGCVIGMLVCFTILRWLFMIADEVPLVVILLGIGIGLLAYPLLAMLDGLMAGAEMSGMWRKLLFWRKND